MRYEITVGDSAGYNCVLRELYSGMDKDPGFSE